MQKHFAGTSCLQGRVFRFTFESEVHIWPKLPEEVHKVGIYATNLDVLAFNPLFNA
jgi:hypothetical protein